MPSLSPRVAIVGACLCWALGTILSKTLLSSFPPVTVLVFQLAPSVVALWLAVGATGAPVPPQRLLLPIALLGLLNPGWAYTFSMFGLTSTSASVTTLLWAFEPILILGLAWTFLKEPVDRQLAMLVAAATIGVLLVSGLVASGSTLSTDIGVVLILAGVWCCAIYTVLARNIDADPLFTVALQQTVAFGWMLAIWPIELRSAQMPPVATIPISDIATIIVSGLLYYAAAYWLYLRALRSMPASIAGSFFNLIPVFGIIGAFVLLGERLSPPQWCGAVMIVGAAIIVLRRNYDAPGTEADRRDPQQERPLSMLDDHQLDDLGISHEQAGEIDEQARHRHGRWDTFASRWRSP
ncbi:DMT family transporter [Rhizobiales bacterium 3FA27D7]|jgi:drug/metabolite transporter (DMT)-like permease|uniref:DMT family transporter n=1 Tax=Mesorhizobium sp. 2RAF21 TaxID=3232995 RepID=UPI00148530D7